MENSAYADDRRGFSRTLISNSNLFQANNWCDYITNFSFTFIIQA